MPLFQKLILDAKKVKAKEDLKSNKQKLYLLIELVILNYEQSLYNNQNSLEANRNYNNSVKNKDKEQIGYSLNFVSSKTGSDNKLDNFNAPTVKLKVVEVINFS